MEGRGKQSPFEGSVLGFLKCLGKMGKRRKTMALCHIQQCVHQEEERTMLGRTGTDPKT